MRKSGFLPSGNSINVLESDQAIGSVSDGTYFTCECEAGEKTFKAVPYVVGGEKVAITKVLKIEPGKTYYLLVDMTWGPKTTLELLGDDDGKQVMGRLSQISSSAVETAPSRGK